MRIGFVPVMAACLFVWSVNAEEADSVRVIDLDGVTVRGSFKKHVERLSTQPVDVVEKAFLHEHFTGDLIRTLDHLPGIHSMDIGSGFSKPMIRGMGFNRISVAENGIKQEGQQWGADHGLELDAFNAERIVVRKGPASLLYGSDAMGGVIELSPLPAPASDGLSGEAVLLAGSVNEMFGGSVMLGMKRGAWYVRCRYTEKHFGDYRVPADTVVYLTRRMPIYGGRLKNTAGMERDVALRAEYRRGRYFADCAVSNAYQTAGFFPGAHGIPDAARLPDDGDSRNMDLPRNNASHLKMTTRQQYLWDGATGHVDAGYQRNLREEWSRFHSHYGNSQPVPETDPDKELGLRLETYSLSAKVVVPVAAGWEHTVGWDVQYQQNGADGYAFLLPAYERFSTGGLWLATYSPNSRLSVSGGVRYDHGAINVSAATDPYLELYLRGQGYAEATIAGYRWRCYAADRRFGNFSGSLGIVWTPAGGEHLIKGNIGRSFRLPTAGELAANGVHHGAFRHEQGDPALASERGWQADVFYRYERQGLSVAVSPFAAWFDHYIYLRPSGEWSVLPHTGQIYRYTDVRAAFAGGEIAFEADLRPGFGYRLAGEYVYTYNVDEHTPLSFSPPASVRNVFTWRPAKMQLYAEWQHIAAQNRTAKNEEPTPGTNLIHAGAIIDVPLRGIKATITLSFHNLLNTRYRNHLSFYRKIEIPEPGRNMQVVTSILF
jgi:iron complex outermembrane receptor protein